MWIDSNAFIGHWPFHQLRHNTCDGLLAKMDGYGVELSLISNLNGIFYKNPQPANEELLTSIKSQRKFRDRFIPFAVINPVYAAWKTDLLECISKMDIKGIRIYPSYHDYSITDPSLIELVKMARDKNLVVSVSLRMVDSRVRSWMDLSTEWNMNHIMPLIREVPDAKYLVVNVANAFVGKQEDIELIRKVNIIFDSSGRNITDLGELMKKFGKERFSFGTHFPFLDYLSGMLRIQALGSEEADVITKELLQSGNIKRMLGI